jgi:competence protein ComFC
MSTSLAYFLYRFTWGSLDLIFPPICGGCGQPGSRWCQDCQSKVQHLVEPVCSICGISMSVAGLCSDCQRARPRYRILRSWSVFEAPVRNALHKLKYRRDMALGDALAAQLSEFTMDLKWPVEMIVPVPLGKKRLEERGYNQVSLIARPLALAAGIFFAPDALIRVCETRSQVALTKAERRSNVSGAFEARGTRVNGRIVLLMDDVATTGSTLSSCAEALYAAGARDVFALTASRALAHHGLNSV